MRLLYFLCQLKEIHIKLTVEEGSLMKEQQERFENFDTKNPSYYVQYFREMLESDEGDAVSLLLFKNLNVDILLGNDNSLTIPFNTGIIFAKFDDLILNYQKKTVEKLSAALQFAGGIMKYQDIVDAR